MISTLMIYCFAMAALISVAAFAFEKALALLGWPRRTVWIAGLIASIGLPLFMILTSEPSSTRSQVETSTPFAGTFDSFAPAGAFSAATSDSSLSARLEAVSPTILLLAWSILSIGVVLFVLFGWIRLRAARHFWTADTVEGTDVRVAENLGPAVVGYFRPEIVVPRWLLAAPQTERRAAIAHERSHIVAGDTFLLFVATLLVVAMPWNLPMWWQLRRLRFAIEVDCDRRVLRDGISVETYGEMLLAVGQRHSRLLVGAMAMSEPVSQLERRIRIMTRATFRLAKPLTVVALAMSTSIVAMATQLKAPSLKTNSPDPIAASIADKAPAQQEIPIVTAPTTNEAKTPSAPAPVATNAAATSPATAVFRASDRGKAATAKKPVQRLAQAPATLSGPSAATPIFNFTFERFETINGESVFYNVVAKRSVGEKFDVFQAARGEVHVTTEARQTLVLYDGVRFEEGPGARDIRITFAQLSLLVPPQTAANTVATPAGTKTSPANQTGGENAERLNLKFDNIDVRAVIKAIADVSGQNVLVSDKVSGKISIQLSNVPWNEALYQVCSSAGLSMRKQGDVISIVPDAGVAQSQSNASANATSNDRGIKRTRYVQPVAPSGAQGSGRWVEVAFTVDPSGTVKAAEIRNRSDANGDLDEPALTAVRQWLFEPAIKDGLAIDTRTLIRIRF